MLAFTPRSAQGATVSWTNAAGGNWGSAANWVAAPTGSTPPATTDNAAFNILNGYTVSLDVNPSISGVGIGGSNVTFAGSLGHTLTNTGGLTVTSGSLNLTSGSNVNFTNVGTISLSANATVSSGNDLSGPGLAVTNGATATFTGPGTTLGATPNGILVDGNGTTLSFSSNAAGASGPLSVATGGSGGTSGLGVSGGATLSTQGITLATAAVAGKVGNLTVSGTGSTLTNTGAITMGASALSSATMTVSGGGAVVTSGGDLNVTSTGVININSGGALTINNRNVALGSGSGTQGKLLVDGSGSSFSQTGNFGITVGGAAGSAATIQTINSASFSTGTAGLTINSAGLVDIAGGTFSVNSNITVNGILQRNGIGSLDWASSKTMSVQNGGQFNVTGGYATPNSASITVTGATSSLTQSTSGSLSITGGSSLTISSGATVNAFAERISDGGAGVVTQSSGTHNITGGGAAGGATLMMGFGFGGTGTYNLSGGSLTVTNDNTSFPGEIVGNFGTGSFVQTGGSHEVTGANGSLVIGAAATGVGTYTLSNNAAMDCTSLRIGRDSGATGTLTLASGSTGFVAVVSGGFIEMGNSLSSSGTLNVNGGSIGSNGIYVGGTSTAAGGVGVLNVTAGQVDAGSAGPLEGSGQLRVWNTSGSAINLSGGSISCATLSTSGNPSHFHWTGNGRLNITGDAGFDVSSGAELGNTITLDAGKSLYVTKRTNIGLLASISLSGPGLSIFNTGSLSGVGSLSATVDGSINVGGDDTSSTFTGTISGDGSFAKNGAGKLSVTNLRMAGVGIHGGTIAILPSGGANSGTTVVGLLNVDNTGKLDLTDNKLIVNSTDVATVTGFIKSGFNLGGTLWAGTTGITTSLGGNGASSYTALGVIRNDYATIGLPSGPIFTSFGGISVGTTDVLVKYTWFGDADLNGIVNSNDYFQIDTGFLAHRTGWINGDFDYNGVINSNDYFVIDNAFLHQGGVVMPVPPASAAPAGVSAVPEPAFMSVAALTLVGMRRRRRGGDLRKS